MYPRDDQLTDAERLVICEFQREHIDCNNEFSSSVGGRLSYIITPTGLGNIVKVRCNYCGEIRDLTNYDSW